MPDTWYPNPASSGGTEIGGVLQTDPTGAYATSTLAPNIARASFLGFAPKDFTAATVRWAVTTGGAAYSTTWAEIAIATGDPVLGGNPTLTVQGYTSVQASVQAGAASYSTSVTATVTAGDGVWAVFATAGGLSPTLRSISADAMQPGMFCQNTTGAWRPSSNVGTPTVWTLSSAIQDGLRAVVFIP